MKNINRLSIVTSVGANSYIVGVLGVTLIEEDGKQIGNDAFINVFRVYKGNDLYAEVSQNCPYEVAYKNGEEKSKSNEQKN